MKKILILFVSISLALFLTACSDSEAKEITQLKYIIDGAHDADFNALGDQLQIDLSF